MCSKGLYKHVDFSITGPLKQTKKFKGQVVEMYDMRRQVKSNVNFFLNCTDRDQLHDSFRGCRESMKYVDPSYVVLYFYRRTRFILGQSNYLSIPSDLLGLNDR